MSFSGKVKEELAGTDKQRKTLPDCRMRGNSVFFGREHLWKRGEQTYLRLSTENIAVARKYFTLLEKAFNIKAEISIRRNQDKKSILYLITVGGRKHTDRIQQAAKACQGSQKTGGIFRE